MKNFKLVFALLLLIGGVSCRKDKYVITYVRVTVIDGNTHLCVPNVKITLYEWKNKSTALGSGRYYDSRIIKDAMTNSNGQIDFGDFGANLGNKYSYGVAKGIVDPSQNANVKKGTINNVTLTGILPY